MARTPGVSWSSRWWNRVTKAILTLGALAGAIAAILALRPSPDLQDSAQFTAVRITSQVPLSEYRQRSAAMVPQEAGHSLGRQQNLGTRAQAAELAKASADKHFSPVAPFAVVRRLQLAPTSSSQTAPTADTSAQDSSSQSASSDTATSDTATPSTATWDTATSDTATPSSATSTPSTTGPAAPPAAGVLSPSVGLAATAALKPKDYSAFLLHTYKLAEAQEPSLQSCVADPNGCPVTYFVLSSSLGPDGNVAPAAVAAHRVVKILRDARSTGGPGRRGEPLGVVVSADLEVAGLRGKPLLLSWSMWQQGGKKRLFGNWLNRTLAFRLLPTTDHDTTSLDLWVPLPRSPGRYFIRVDLTEARSPLASADSALFD